MAARCHAFEHLRRFVLTVIDGRTATNDRWASHVSVADELRVSAVRFGRPLA